MEEKFNDLAIFTIDKNDSIISDKILVLLSNRRKKTGIFVTNVSYIVSIN